MASLPAGSQARERQPDPVCKRPTGTWLNWGRGPLAQLVELRTFNP